MTALLTVNDISKTFGIHQVLDRAHLIVNPGDRVGLVGANGSGKSTLIKIITGAYEADSGQIAFAPDIRTGYLAQVIRDYGDASIDDLINRAIRALRQLENHLRQLEARMTALEDEDALDAVMHEYGESLDRFERWGGYELDSRIDTILNGLRIGHIDRSRPFASLSGGEKARVGLGMLLMETPDLMLLDEPTNHLDLASLTWLEDYLRAFRGGVLVVSHDRQFLNRSVNAIVEIDEHTHQTRRYTGDYERYLQVKAQERQQWDRDYAQQQDEIKELRYEIKEGARQNNNYRTHQDGDKFVRNFKKAKHDRTVSRRVRVAEEKLKRIEDNPVPQPPDDLRFDAEFDPDSLGGRYPLIASGLAKHYGERRVLDDLSFALRQDSRVTLVGPNGAGKSTLLRILVGLETADSGEIIYHPGMRIGYLDQEGDALNPDLSAIDAFLDGLEGSPQSYKAKLLQMGLFRYDELEKRVGNLSSGQQRKLQIARLIVKRANILILDEPTNYISFDVLEGLEAALRVFSGPVIAATHDRRFMQQIGGEIWELRDGAIIQHLDGYPEYKASLAGFGVVS